MMEKIKKGFSLIEMILSITLFAAIIVLAFDVIGNMGITKIKQSDRIDIDQDLFYVIENLSSNIKDFGGDIDYEEYWNRKQVGTASSSGYYSVSSGFGNFGIGGLLSAADYGENYYYCASPNGSSIGSNGCGKVGYQRYGQYAFQFVDFNSNQNADGIMPGDENGDGNIRGDDDDENLGLGPLAFSGNEVKELYLINKGKKSERFLIRLNIGIDINSPPGTTCVNGTGSGCLGKLQMLKLTGKDLGMSHTALAPSSGQYDGVIDTWQCSPNFACSGADNVPLSIDDGWIDLTPAYINVKEAKFFIYPNKDFKLAWKESSPDLNINPFVRINMTLGYAWERKKKLKGENPSITLTTSINLTKN